MTLLREKTEKTDNNLRSFGFFFYWFLEKFAFTNSFLQFIPGEILIISFNLKLLEGKHLKIQVFLKYYIKIQIYS